MSTIGEKQVEMVRSHVESLFRDYLSDIEDAYKESENEITVTFSAKIFPHPTMANETKVKTKIRFTPKATTDEIEGVCSEIQEKIPFHETTEYPSGQEPGRVTKVKDDELADGDPVDAVEGAVGAQGPEAQEGDTIQPNENGVFEVEPMFSFESKKAKANIMLVEYKSKWYQGTDYEVKNAGGGGGLPSVNGTAYATSEDALDAAKQHLIGSLDSVIILHPDKRPAIKKIIVWAEGLTMADANTQERKPEPGETIGTQEPTDLDLQIEFLAQRSQSQGAELEQVKDWFSEVVAKVIAESFPRFTYIKADEVLDWLDTVVSLGVGIDGNGSLLDELRIIMANRKGYNDCIFRYIDDTDLQPDNLVDKTGEPEGAAA